MPNYGEGITGDAIEQNVDIARLQAQAIEAQRQIPTLELPPTGFVAALNGQSGAVSIANGTNIGVAVGPGTVTISVTGLGTMASKNVAAAVADLATVASAAYVQAEAQAVIDKLNALLQSLRAAVHIAP